MRVGVYARVSTVDQQTLPMQVEAMRRYVDARGWQVAMEIQEIGSGAARRPKRDRMVLAARRRELDVIVVWRLDRWGRNLSDLITTLEDLSALGVGFVSVTEAMDLTTPTGRAMVGMLAVFAAFERDVLRERVKAGIAAARAQGKPHGRPATSSVHLARVRALHTRGMNASAIARETGIPRTSVRRLLNQ